MLTVRTPPKHQNDPFLPPPGDEVTPQHPHPGYQSQQQTPHPSKPSELNRVQILHVHPKEVKQADRDTRPPSLDNQELISVASRLPPQQPDPLVRQIHGKHGLQDGVRVHAPHQQPRKAPSRDLIEEFMPPAQVVNK